jgi:hypothetical protein
MPSREISGSPALESSRIGRAAGVEHGIAVQCRQLARILDRHSTVAGVDGPGRRLDGEPSVSLNGDIKRIVRLADSASPTRDEIRSVARKSDRTVSRPRQLRFKTDAVRPIADRIHIGDVGGDRLQTPLQGHLSGKSDIEPRLHEETRVRQQNQFTVRSGRADRRRCTISSLTCAKLV